MIPLPARPPWIRMRFDLRQPFGEPVWPAGIQLQGFAAEQAAGVHELLAGAYAHAGGSVNELPAWWSSLASDSEFEPELVFVAWDAGSRIVGVAQCWTSAYIKDLAVRPNWRRRGLGRALLLHAFDAFKRRGAQAVDLKVEENNVPAIRLYQSVGMHDVPE